jgi:hypothetical protein
MVGAAVALAYGLVPRLESIPGTSGRTDKTIIDIKTKERV